MKVSITILLVVLVVSKEKGGRVIFYTPCELINT